jgi:hypothetical protein
MPVFMRFFVGKYIHSLGNVRNCKKPMLNAHFMGILVVVLYYGMVVVWLGGLRFYFLSIEIVRVRRK